MGVEVVGVEVEVEVEGGRVSEEEGRNMTMVLVFSSMVEGME